MADFGSMHSLDTELSKFDAFLEKKTQHARGEKTSGLIYAFFSNKESNARIDATSLRTCLVASYVGQLFGIRGANFCLSSSANEILSTLVQAEFAWTFSTAIDRRIDIDRYGALLKKAATERSCRSCGRNNIFCLDVSGDSTGDRDGGFGHIPILRDDNLSAEAAEAARIASLLFVGGDTSLDQSQERHSIAVVPEDSIQTWEKVKRILEWIRRLDKVQHIDISTVTVGCVTFVNGWAASLIDYFTSRRKLIDLSYRHKFATSGGDETSAPTATRSALTFASIIFELMSFPIRRSVTIEEIGYRNVDGEKEAILPQWARNGVFVLYNYARLCAILSKYGQGVIGGRYPDLLPLEKLDDGVKTKISQEMSSLIDWFSRASDLNIGIDAFSTSRPNLPNLRNDLFNFSGRFSNFYSKRRVLTEALTFSGANADALIAKIHVLSRLKKLYLFWFSIMSIPAVEVM